MQWIVSSNMTSDMLLSSYFRIDMIVFASFTLKMLWRVTLNLSFVRLFCNFLQPCNDL